MKSIRGEWYGYGWWAARGTKKPNQAGKSGRLEFNGDGGLLLLSPTVSRPTHLPFLLTPHLRFTCFQIQRYQITLVQSLSVSPPMHAHHGLICAYSSVSTASASPWMQKLQRLHCQIYRPRVDRINAETQNKEAIRRSREAKCGRFHGVLSVNLFMVE